MGILIGCEHVSHEWPGKTVLADQTIGINEGDRIGIVGKNGDGKSTLLDLISRRLEPDDGSIVWRNGIDVGVLAQEDDLADDETVEHAVVGDAPEYAWASDARVRSIMDELLVDIDWHGRVGELSGGQRRRCDLARVLVGTWDVLLMDEPTNHLDLHAITWLANHLKRRWAQGQGALLLVTHDRWFLDEVCEHMWEVHDGMIDPFEGGYSAYIQQRVERQRQAAVMEERRQNTLRKELNWLAHGAKARTSKPKFRIDAAMALLADDPPLRNPVELRRMAVSRLGKQVMELKNVSCGYGEKTVLSGVDWLIGPGDRYGILGENGVGKSTLLKIMTGRMLPTKGFVKIGKSVKFGILSQHLDQLSEKDDWRVSELLGTFKRYFEVDGKMQSPEQMLERLGFERREFPTYIRDLSGGQRRRLAILCVLMQEPNVLVLDEPGNDLDTDMLAVLEDLLDTWPGTLILVSHDRYLMERVTDDQFAILDGRIRHVPGGVDEYLRLLGSAEHGGTPSPGSPERGAKVAAPGPAASEDNGVSGATSSSGLSNAERRELKKRYDAVSRKLDKMSGEPDRLREGMRTLDASDYEGLMAAQAELDETLAAIDELETEWLELSERLGIG
ncbi:MAG: ABC-F family ATP-binding cassette domain-containing protein [Olsenella sp.]|nr:ABC-F family ATP-binding cassette domain-containing protein [Olsenella sp.]